MNMKEEEEGLKQPPRGQHHVSEGTGIGEKEGETTKMTGTDQTRLNTDQRPVQSNTSPEVVYTEPLLKQPSGGERHISEETGTGEKEDETTQMTGIDQTQLNTDQIAVQSNTSPGIVSTEPIEQTLGDKSVVAMTQQIPRRQDRNKCGTRGKPIIVETNYFALNLTRALNDTLIHYDVTLEPSVPRRMLRAAMEEFRLKHYPNRFPAFDGNKNLYSSGELPFGRKIYDDIVVHDSEHGKERKFKITIKYATQIDLQSLVQYMGGGTSLHPAQQAIQAVDIVLRNAPAFRFVPIGRSFFTPPKYRAVQLGGGLELWHGFYQSAILGWKPFVNIDVAHKGFPAARNVVEIILDICKLRHEDLQKGLTDWQKEDFLNYIRGLKIDYVLPDKPTSKRTYGVHGITKSAAAQFFELDDKKSISVAEYYAREKKIRLSYPHLPCLHVGSVNRLKPIYVPVELCSVTSGQVTKRKMKKTQLLNTLREIRTTTDVRKQKIRESLKLAAFDQDSCMKEFGFSVNDQFEKVEARVLQAPTLQYNLQVDERNVVKPEKGAWNPLIFVSSNKLSHWMILNLNRFINEDELRMFIAEMQNVGRALGIDIGTPLPPKFMQPPTKNIHQLTEFFTAVKKRVQLVVVIVPDNGSCYAKVKQVAELNTGVLTQCVKGRTISRFNHAICSNILLKINSKLNGVNHTFAEVSRTPCLRRSVMIVGADVTHPSPDQSGIPSIAAVSASYDPTAFRYHVQIRLQPPKLEIIQDMENIMRQQLEFFYRHNSCKPEGIVLFRDGVGEGQFAQVLDSEVNAIRRACSSMNQEYKPKVTFLVVQKRHHTRLFPRREDAEGRSKNVPPGTVVDREITHPTEVDFFMVSHCSNQGVSRPTRYHLLCNDDDAMTENELQDIAYYLCHMFSRCTHSVSYPAPTYYAHLAAQRARVYLEGQMIKLSNLEHEQEKCAVVTEIISGHPMFFV
jgi:eukaryotic translation initiation factor 2C